MRQGTAPRAISTGMTWLSHSIPANSELQSVCMHPVSRTCALAMSITLIVTALTGQDPDKEDHDWTDNRTGLTWTPWDNGYNVTLAEAIRYCRELKFDGHQDWRLPEIAELEALYDPNAPGLIPGPVLRSSEWMWSATRTDIHGGNWGTSAWLFSFVGGR